MKKQIILASGSPRRLELLQQIGLRPIVVKSRIEEKITETDPALVVEELSRQKACDVAEHLEEYLIESSFSDPMTGLSETNIDPVPVFNPSQALVLGADTVVSCDGKILGKPHSHDEAFQMIKLLQGRSHQVYTGVTLALPESSDRFTFHEETIVHVVPMTDAEIRAYAESAEPMDKAGAYGIQGTFGKFIDRIEGDYYNVVGLPLAQVYAEIKKFVLR
ncbi:MAG: Maf family protein [Lachnospiraceae bacterium]|jgi:septum formation protein|nr:Maf family protein [Lachnospiraceae bacterium]